MNRLTINCQLSTVNYTLVAPLNWGLGHAARVIPIINRLINEGAEVMIGGNGESLKFLRAEFPNLKYVELPGVNIKYSSGKSQVWAVLRQLPSIIHYSIKEHKAIKDIVRRYNITEVISDNRFGLFGSGVRSVYITHQIMVKMPAWLKLLEPLGYRMHKRIIERYDECWIPDYAEAERSLAGDLTHKYPLPHNARFIGPLSRFTDMKDGCKPVDCDVLAIMSGVEPHRTLFEKSIAERYHGSKLKVILVRGKSGLVPSSIDYGNIEVKGVLTASDLLPYILGAKKIICRSGYTTVMDMHLLGKTNLEWSATPGQTEQEYLLTQTNLQAHIKI